MRQLWLWGVLTLVCSSISAQSENWSLTVGFKIEVVASDLHLPVNLAFVPNPRPEADAPLFYVSELYGQIKAVLRNGQVFTYAQDLLNFNPTGNFPGSGETGVVGVRVDPGGDLFITTAYFAEGIGFKNRIVRLHSDAAGHAMVDSTHILDNIPGTGFSIFPSHQIQALSFGPDGKLYAQVGDGFDTPDAAQDDEDLRGKILRLNPDGSIPADNPTPGSYVYAKGFRNPFGGAWRSADGRLYVSDNGPDVNDRIVRVTPGGNAGWPANLTDGAIKLWTPTIGVTAVDFCHSAAFPPEYQGRLFAASAGPTYVPGPTNRGKRIEMFALDAAGNVIGEGLFLTYTGSGFATVVGLAFSEDGLYFTDLYGEAGFDQQGLTHANVYRVYHESTVGTREPKPLPETFRLAQNYPNPFNPGTTIEFSLGKPATVSLKIYDAGGREVETLLQRTLLPGTHSVFWEGGERAVGVYYYRLTVDRQASTRKMLLIR